MEDLLRSQIRDSCRLALPEGLKDLMSDISREVLRAQPQNIYQFITDYLSALLVAREHLFIAARVCDDVCKNRCCAELEDELRELSLSDEDVDKCLEIIKKYFSRGAVKEGNLLQRLGRETKIRQDDIPSIQEAVRRAFLRHQINNTVSVSSTADNELDETMLAAKHTLGIYKKATENPDINYDCVASKIQAAYRAYNVRRKRTAPYEPHSRKKEEEKVHFNIKAARTNETERLLEDVVHIHTKRCASKCSSVSLAGSFLSLPLYKPYSIGQHSDITEVDEVGAKEKEHASFDYVTNRLDKEPKENQFREPDTKGKKTISFHKFPVVLQPDDNELSDEIDEADYESDEVDEEVTSEECADETVIIHRADENAANEHSSDSSDEDVIDENYKKFSDEENAPVVEEVLPYLEPNESEVVPESILMSQLKGDTESSESYSEDLDEAIQNETERIFENLSVNDEPEKKNDQINEVDNDDELHDANSVEIKSTDMKDYLSGNKDLKTVAGEDNLTDEESENFLV